MKHDVAGTISRNVPMWDVEMSRMNMKHDMQAEAGATSAQEIGSRACTVISVTVSDLQTAVEYKTTVRHRALEITL